MATPSSPGPPTLRHMVIGAATSTAPATATPYPTFDDTLPGRPVEEGPCPAEPLSVSPPRAWLRIVRRATAFVAVVASAALLLALGQLLLLPLPRARRRF